MRPCSPGAGSPAGPDPPAGRTPARAAAPWPPGWAVARCRHPACGEGRTTWKQTCASTAAVGSGTSRRGLQTRSTGERGAQPGMDLATRRRLLARTFCLLRQKTRTALFTRPSSRLQAAPDDGRLQLLLVHQRQADERLSCGQVTDASAHSTKECATTQHLRTSIADAALHAAATAGEQPSGAAAASPSACAPPAATAAPLAVPPPIAVKVSFLNHRTAPCMEMTLPGFTNWKRSFTGYAAAAMMRPPEAWNTTCR